MDNIEDGVENLNSIYEYQQLPKSLIHRKQYCQYYTFMHQNQFVQQKMSFFSIISKRIQKQKSSAKPSLFQFAHSPSAYRKKVIYIAKNPCHNHAPSCLTLCTQSETNSQCLKYSLKSSLKKSNHTLRNSTLKMIKKKTLKTEKKTERQILQESDRINKMDEYLRDYELMKSQGMFHPTEMIALVNQTIISQKTKSPKKKYHSRRRTKDQDEVTIDKFHGSYFPEFFREKPLDDTAENGKFENLLVVNTGNRNYFRKPYSCKNSQFITQLKHSCHKLTKYSLKLSDNIFFCALFSGFKRPYTNFESFFWIGKSIRHVEKNQIIKSISNFLKDCIEEKAEVQTLFVSNYTYFYKPKIWVVDYEGRLSYLKEGDKLVNWEDEERKTEKKQKEIGIDNIYRMFIKNRNKGRFQLKKCIVIDDA